MAPPFGGVHLSLSPSSISNQDVGFTYSLEGRQWRWKTRMVLSGMAPTFQIVDIITPYGMLRDSIPLPGAVVTAMAESLANLKANFKPTILIGPPSSITIYADEGRGFSSPVQGLVTNSGVYGSLLSCTLVTSSEYLIVNVDAVGHLAFNQSGTFEVTADSTDLLTSQSPYTGSVTLQDLNSTNLTQQLPVTIVVRPKALISLSQSLMEFTVTRPLTGSFPPIPVQQFNVQNSGSTGSLLDFQIVKLTGLSANWLGSVTPITGSLSASGISTITVEISPVDGLMPGTYEETLRVSGYSSNSYADIVVRLVVV